MADHKKTFSHLLKESILQLCNARLSHDKTLEIDGVICVTVGDDDENHIVVKVHETISAVSSADNANCLTDMLKHINDTVTSENVASSTEMCTNIGDAVMPFVSQEHSIDVANSVIDENHQQCHGNKKMNLRSRSLPEADTTNESELDDAASVTSETQDVYSFEEGILSVLVRNTPRHSCGVCDKVFSTRSALVKHTRTHTGERPYKCNVCDARFSENAMLRRHQTTIHIMPPGQAKHSRQFPCEICGRVLLSRQSLKHHVLAVHEGIKRPQKKGLCAYCGKICRTATALKEHQNKWHLNIKPFLCKTCGRSFHAKPVLRVHEKQAHTNVRKFPCDTCGKAFKRHNDLKDHLLTHSETRPYQCDICKKRYKKKPVLTRHYRLHSGLKPFDCKACSASFADASILRRHVIAIHKVPREKWHKNLTAEDLKVIAEKPQCHDTSLNKRKGNSKAKRKNTLLGKVMCSMPGEKVPVSGDNGSDIKRNDDVANAISLIQQSIPASNVDTEAVKNKRDDELTTGDSVILADNADRTSNEQTSGGYSDDKTIHMVEDETGNVIVWDGQMMPFEQVYVLVTDPVVQSTEELVTTHSS